MGALWFVLLWYQVVHYLPALRAITGCRHTRGHVKECAPDITGRPCIVVWFCSECTFQAPLRMVRQGRNIHGRLLWVVTEEGQDGKAYSGSDE